MVTVPVEAVPPVTLVGATDSVVSTGGVMIRVTVCIVSLALAEIVADVEVPTALVATAKVAVVAPAATVTLAGTVAAAVLLLERVTAVPPLGAAFVSVTIPVEEPPPVTVAGFSVTPDTTAAEVCTVKSVLPVIPLMAAVIVVLPVL
jgi:hypothetical protein